LHLLVNDEFSDIKSTHLFPNCRNFPIFDENRSPWQI
jgi:hypothetical protein